MSHGLCGISRLGHRAQHHVIYHRCQVGVLRSFKKLRELLRLWRACCFKGKTQPFQSVTKSICLLGGRRLVNPVNKGQLFFFAEPCRALVCREHEVLDHFLAASAGVSCGTDADVLFVYHQHALHSLELGSSAEDAFFLELVRKLAHKREHTADLCVFLVKLRRGLAVEHGVYLAVNALDTGADNSFSKLEINDLRLVVELCKAGKSKPVLAGIQRADAV